MPLFCACSSLRNRCSRCGVWPARSSAHCSVSSMTSMSQQRTRTSPFAARVRTVRRRHCESDAVFSPRPKRPRSSGARGVGRVDSAERHRPQQGRLVHPGAVVRDGDPGGPPLLADDDPDRCRPGGDAVVDDVRDGGFEIVTRRAHGTDERGSTGGDGIKGGNGRLLQRLALGSFLRELFRGRCGPFP